MTAIEKFNKQKHKYIYYIEQSNNNYCAYIIHGIIGNKSFLYHSLREAIRIYNQKAKLNSPPPSLIFGMYLERYLRFYRYTKKKNK